MPKLYTIGEVSELLNVPKSTIRFWDEQGLIHSLRHEENGYRMFNIDDIFQIYDINFYRKLDVPIKQMKNLYGKTIEEHYATIAETEQRIKQEKISLQKKHEEILARKEQLKLMIDNRGITKETIPFAAIVIVDSDDILDSKAYLENYASFGGYFDFSLSDEMIYGFCTDQTSATIPLSKIVWYNQPGKTYHLFLLQVEVNHTEKNNIEEVRLTLAQRGYQTGNVIGQYLLTKQTEEGVYHEYYLGWIESQKVEADLTNEDKQK
ncbi:MerR family transcriptional regulator [Enterococcus hirae]|uniref:MerR family transcriptional regulator n=1 Tax=Enterococcus hirae TaxID=1354 RepID=UPI001624A3B9|nr:MerR family transcriptional regulator [Enterococcus hirae]QNG05634.1 MerR family transcriptional regulator [Enterococcus hirae]